MLRPRRGSSATRIVRDADRPRRGSSATRPRRTSSGLDRPQIQVEMCDKSGVEFDLSTSSTADPATLAVRLSGDPSAPGAALATINQCNMSKAEWLTASTPRRQRGWFVAGSRRRRGDNVDGSWTEATLSRYQCAPRTIHVVAGASTRPSPTHRSPAGLYGISAILGLQAMLLSHQLMPSQRVWTPHFRRVDIPRTGRGGAAATNWTFRGDESRRRRGCDVDSS